MCSCRTKASFECFVFVTDQSVNWVFCVVCSCSTKASLECFVLVSDQNLNWVFCVRVVPSPYLNVLCSCRTKSSLECFILCVCVVFHLSHNITSCRPKSSLECLCCVFRRDHVLSWLLLVFGVLAVAGMTTVPVHAYVLVVSVGRGQHSEDRTDDERSYLMDDYSQ